MRCERVFKDFKVFKVFRVLGVRLRIIYITMKKTIDFMKVDELDARLCDTPVPFLDLKVKCGLPSILGDPSYDEYSMLPYDLVGRNPVCIVVADGKSMLDAGIESGDRLLVQSTHYAQDGDIVVARIDGEYTVKAYMCDGQGRQWLVPYNDAFSPILLKEDMEPAIHGKVLSVIKTMGRMPHREMMRKISCFAEPDREVPQERKAVRTMEQIIAEVAPMVTCRRHWYAAYRAMVDTGMLKNGMCDQFIETVARAVPEHKHLPNKDALQRMAVGCFCKPVDEWEADKAPVSASRFEKYVRIAQKVIKG